MFHMVFFQFYEPPDLGKKIFTTWNVLKPELYLTCISFWKFHDDVKGCLEVIRLPSWPENVKFSVKLHFLDFWPREKSVFKWIPNSKFSFSGIVHFPPKPIFPLKFSNFQGDPENAPNHIVFSNSARKILKMAIKSELHGLCNWNFWNFVFSMKVSNGENFKDFKIFDLTWIWWIWLEWPMKNMEAR